MFPANKCSTWLLNLPFFILVLLSFEYFMTVLIHKFSCIHCSFNLLSNMFTIVPDISLLSSVEVASVE